MTRVSFRLRRLAITGIISLIIIIGGLFTAANQQPKPQSPQAPASPQPGEKARTVLDTLVVRGRAAKTGYSRSQFGNGWADWRMCTTGDKILARDMTNVVYQTYTCVVESGTLDDPYTNKIIEFKRGPGTSQLVQIDHVVALSDAWQKGAQQLSRERRTQFANDDLNLLAADGPANTQKGAGDAATWLPKNKSFRCQYFARQIAVKAKYILWITAAEKAAMKQVITTCPDQPLPAR